MRTVTFARSGSFAVLKSGRYCLHGIVELNLALFVELHDGSRRGKGFCQRRQVEDRVLGHRLHRCRRSIKSRFVCQLARAISLVENDLVTVPDHIACRSNPSGAVYFLAFSLVVAHASARVHATSLLWAQDGL